MASIVFRDRIEAALALGTALFTYRVKRACVLCVDCATLPTGRIVADMLGAQLRLVGVHSNVSTPGTMQALLALAEQRRERCGTCSAAGIARRVVIVLDDGTTPPAVTESALRLVRDYHPARVVYAATVAVTTTLQRISSLADECVYLAATGSAGAVAANYLDYSIPTESEVLPALFPTPLRAGQGAGTCAECLRGSMTRA